MAKELEMTFSLGAKLAASFSAAFNAAGAHMNQFAKRTESFAKTANNIKTFEAVQKKLQSHQKALEGYQKKLKSIQFSGNTAEIEQLNMKIAESQNTIARETSQIEDLRSALQGAGVDMNNLTGEQARLTAAAERSAKAQQSYQKAVAQLDKDKKAMSLSTISSGLMSAGAYLAPLGVGVKQAMGFEKAMSQVRAVSSMTDDQFKNLTAFVEEQAGTTIYGPEETAKVAENLARAGYGVYKTTDSNGKEIEKNQIMEMLPAVLKGAAANGISTDQMSGMLSDVMGAYGFGADKAQYVMDAMITAAKQSNQTVSDVYENIKQAGPMLKTMGASFEQAMAYTNALSSKGIKGSEAGNTIKRIFTQVTTNSAAQKQLAALGIGYKDKAGNMRSLESLMKEVGQKIQNKGSAEQSAILKNILGSYAITGGSGFMESVMSGEFDKYLEGMKNSKGTTDETYKTMIDNAWGDVVQLGNAFTNLKMAIGKPLIDPFRFFVQGATKAVQVVADFMKEHPALVKGIGAIATSMAAVSAGSVLMKAGIAAIRFPFDQINVWVKYLKMVGDGSALVAIKTKALAAVQSVVAGATKVWSGVQWVLNAALSACPITWIVAGVAAVAGAAYLLYKNWDKVCAWWSETWDGLSTKILNFGSWLADIGGKLWDGLLSGLSAIGTGFSNLGYWIYDKLVGALTSAGEWLAGVGATIWNGLVSGWESVSGVLVDEWQAVKGYASEFGDWISSTGESIWDGVKSGWDVTKELVVAGWAAYEESINKFQGWLLGKGPVMWEGIKAGWETTKQLISAGWTAYQEGVVKFQSWLLEKGVSLWDGLVSGWESTKTALSDGWTVITGYASEFGEWLTKNGVSLWDGIKSGWKSTKTALANGWNVITGYMTEFGNWIVANGASLWTGLVSGWESTKTALSEGWDAVNGYVTNFSNWMAANGPAIWDGLVTGWETTKTALSDGWTVITRYASEFGEWLTKNGGSLWDGIKSGWETTKTALADGWDVITGYAAEFGNWIVANGSSLWTGLVSGWGFTKTALSDGWDALNELATDYANWLLENGPTIWDGLVTGWNEASKLLSEGWTALEGVVTKFGEWLSNIGSTIWNGLTAGWDAAKGVLEEGLNWVGNAWDQTASFAGDMWDGIKSFMGFESTGNEIIDQKALAQQLNDITVLDKMSKTFADRVAAMTNEWQPFKQSLAEGFENIFSVMTQLVTKITGEFVPAIQQASQSFRDMQTAVAAVATAANGGSQAAPKAPGSSYLFGGAKAKGGILTGPQIVLAGEAGPEAIIPLSNEHYGLPLLQQAASAFGLQVTAPEYSLSELSSNLTSVSNTSMITNTSTNANTNNMTNAPIINITVEGGAESDANSLAVKIRDAVADVLRSLQDDERRVAFA